METYPALFPLPTITGYSMNVDMGLRRTQMENGRFRQRQRYLSMPTQFSLRFSISIDQLSIWQQWVNDYAYEWIVFPATSYLSGNSSSLCSPHLLRFVSDLTVTSLTDEFVAVTVLAEQAPSTMFGPPVLQTDDWIIGGTPASPSLDWVIGKTPDDPAPNVVRAGTPQNPAALI